MSREALAAVQARVAPLLTIIAQRPQSERGGSGTSVVLSAAPYMPPSLASNIGERIVLGPLTAQDVEALARFHLARDVTEGEVEPQQQVLQLPADLRAALSSAAGHPLYVGELLRAWVRARKLSDAEKEASASASASGGDGGEAGSLAALSVFAELGALTLLQDEPSSAGDLGSNLSNMAHLIQCRIDGLSLDAKQIVKAASVIGESFTLNMVGRCCPHLSDERLKAARDGAFPEKKTVFMYEIACGRGGGVLNKFLFVRRDRGTEACLPPIYRQS